MKNFFIKKFPLFFLLLTLSFALQAQNGLMFESVFMLSISGEKIGVIDVVQEENITVEKGTVLKITSAGISELSSFDDTPYVLSNSSQGMIFINGFPITNMPEASIRTVEYPIWLREGTYKVKLVAHSNSVGKKLRGYVNGLIFKIEND